MRYLVFSGGNYYPDGGAQDLVFQTEDTAKAVIYALKECGRTDWAHVLDVRSGVLFFPNKEQTGHKGYIGLVGWDSDGLEPNVSFWRP